MNKHYVYILESKKDSKLYIGSTNNIYNRVSRHNKGRVVSTRNRRPFKLIYSEELNNQREARQRESYLKNLKSSKYIKEHIVNTARS